MKVWLNGAVMDADHALISSADRGFTLGDGLFETMQARDGCVLRLAAHLSRLRVGAGIIGLQLPDVDFGVALTDTLEANALASGVLRLTVTRGVGPRGVLPPAEPAPPSSSPPRPWLPLPRPHGSSLLV